MNAFEVITNHMIKELEKGQIPWRRPWKCTPPINWFTGRGYNGINRLLLESGCQYATFLQIKQAGGKVKKGAKAKTAIFFSIKEGENEETGETEKLFFWKYHAVFEVGADTEGLNLKTDEELKVVYEIKEAEEIITGYKNAPKLAIRGGSAYYSPSLDQITMPEKEKFVSMEEYYSTYFHELGHSTGHTKRLNRNLLANHGFGSHSYSKEELIAEFTSAFLCAKAGISCAVIENQAAYLKGWLKRLKEDKTIALQAASSAQKAAKYILNEQEENRK